MTLERKHRDYGEKKAEKRKEKKSAKCESVSLREKKKEKVDLDVADGRECARKYWREKLGDHRKKWNLNY